MSEQEGEALKAEQGRTADGDAAKHWIGTENLITTPLSEIDRTFRLAMANRSRTRPPTDQLSNWAARWGAFLIEAAGRAPSNEGKAEEHAGQVEFEVAIAHGLQLAALYDNAAGVYCRNVLDALRSKAPDLLPLASPPPGAARAMQQARAALERAIEALAFDDGKKAVGDAVRAALRALAEGEEGA